jgi:general secretion pathway protein I
MSYRRNRGFTLIEVIIAFAILGMTLSTLYGVFSTTLARARHEARLNEAVSVSQSLLSRAGVEWPLTESPVRGELNGYDYEVTQEVVNAPAGQPALTQPIVRVTASVAWSDPAGQRNVSISTLKLLSRSDE